MNSGIGLFWLIRVVRVNWVVWVNWEKWVNWANWTNWVNKANCAKWENWLNFMNSGISLTLGLNNKNKKNYTNLNIILFPKYPTSQLQCKCIEV